ncbi:hypothetical protein Ahy_B08g090402 [Arachis hypogaea]|uniref:Uncharacterized protein n=1 Tax=Arachis hypogaea TaxID=3818 RepID=A0A444Y053_ARAHY|nr:hypothetical protein Ahy_B08g090402 [Arachis hypogaea]
MDKIYNECVKVKTYSVIELKKINLIITNNLNLPLQKMFHFDKDSREIIKRTIIKSMGRSWKKTRCRLYHDYYDSEKVIEQNISADNWGWFLDYHKSEHTKNKSMYVVLSWSKIVSRRKVGRRELSTLVHKQRDSSYIHEEARTIELWRLRNMMNPLDCCLRIIRLLKLLKKSTQVKSLAWVSNRLLVNSSLLLLINRAMELKERRPKGCCLNYKQSRRPRNKEKDSGG